MTTRSTVPAARAGAVVVIVVAFGTAVPVPITSPRTTSAPARNPVPLTVRLVPPPVDAQFGATEVASGGGARTSTYPARKATSPVEPVILRSYTPGGAAAPTLTVSWIAPATAIVPVI